jgi:hypothetical protein
MFPPARCAPSVRLLGTCPEGSYTTYSFHNGLGRSCRWIFLPISPSQSNTVILVIVDRISKSCRLLPLPGLPTALQIVEALFTHVFWHYGVPVLPGLALDPKPAPPSALPEAGSAVCGVIKSPEESERGLL